MKLSPSLRRTIEAALPRLAGFDWVPLTGGRTNHLWRVGDQVVKVFDSSQASPLFPNDGAAEVAALRCFGPLGLAPQLTASGAGWIAYGFLSGSTWQADPRPVAEMLHRLHTSRPDPRPTFRNLPSGGAAIIAQTEAILSECKDRLPLGEVSTVQPGPRLVAVPIHSDIVPGNLIVDAGSVTAIDWQCPALGDPTEDLATFLSPAMQWLYRGRVLTVEERAAFLGAYPDQAVIERLTSLLPAYRLRMAAHCLWRAERGATDYGTALKLEMSP
ncbi:phosphotransferase [Tabrizicola sp. J26]|uniref:phosphotransferase n=1 Tax=Alitabrizicola rongguiensis TaxID=2909234 RepID=UPI001F45D288|nr:phosphotransferase [Tabrizicola rongguiensis]MCF1710641.1 phosphotransferase [Tabrizicola rongguiensis]